MNGLLDILNRISCLEYMHYNMYDFSQTEIKFTVKILFVQI